MPSSEMHSIDRPCVSRPAVGAGRLLAERLDLSKFRLAGGTALAWALGHRRSDDLDFFTREPGGLGLAAQTRLASNLRTLPDVGSVDLHGERTLHATVMGCRVSFFEIQGKWLSSVEMTKEGLALARLDDIAAMKVVSVLTRSAKKDFYDLHALRQHGYGAVRLFELAKGSLPDLIDAEVAQTLVRALLDFSDADLDPDPMSLDGTTWKAAKQTASALSHELEAALRRNRIP
jgi:hypothetical protein